MYRIVGSTLACVTAGTVAALVAYGVAVEVSYWPGDPPREADLRQ